MRARYYDPKLKRFLNRDVIRGEIQDGQTFNRYAYVNGNPVSYIDPLGLSKWETKGSSEPSSPRTGRLKLDLQLFASEGSGKGKFPINPDELMPELPREMKNNKTYIHPNDNTRIRIEQHPLEVGETYNPRHHGLHYHIEVKTDPSKNWQWHNRKNKQDYVKPDDYSEGSGTGFIPGEQFPGFKQK